MKAWWQAHKEQVNAGQRQRYHKNAAKEHARNLKRKFNLTLVDYQALLEKQHGVCGICKQKDMRRLSVDHCHTTGVIRGLLCKKCNQFLWALDHPGWLEQAKQYLTKEAPIEDPIPGH